jgi:hypothetical protein
MRSKCYARRRQVGGALGRITAVNNNNGRIWVRLEKEDVLIEMPGSLSANKVGQRVRVFAKPI